MTHSVRDCVSISASAEENQDPVGYRKPFAEAGTIAGIKTHVGGFALLVGRLRSSWKELRSMHDFCSIRRAVEHNYRIAALGGYAKRVFQKERSARLLVSTGGDEKTFTA